MATRRCRRFRPPGCSRRPNCESLGLGKARAEAVAEKISKAIADFTTMSGPAEGRRRRMPPGCSSAPAAGDGSGGNRPLDQGLRVYENVLGHRGKRRQARAGADRHAGPSGRRLAGDRRAAAVPKGRPKLAASGFFFQASMPARNEAAAAGPSEASQKLLADWRASTRSRSRRPRRTSKPDTSPAGPICSRRSPTPPRSPKTAACGCGNWPT